MTKNSRPDIQVLEARVDRLKAQLLEYRDIRTYEVTKRRLLRVADELEECLSIIGEITDQDKRPVTPVELRDVISPNPETEFEAVDSDLMDIFSIPESSSKSSNDAESLTYSDYSPRFIVKTFKDRIQECAETATGILQVNQFSYLLKDWYNERFTPTSAFSQNKFFYKASRIHEWIDLLILSAGKSLREGKFIEFQARIENWVKTLNTTKDERWVLPYSIIQDRDESGPEYYTKEAVLIEMLLKDILYSEDFYSGEKNSVYDAVRKARFFSEEDVSIDSILHDCTEMIVTSSFDASKYRR